MTDRDILRSYGYDPGDPVPRGEDGLRIPDALLAKLAGSVGVDQVQTRGARYKLKAKNTTHACCEAIRRGLIP